MAKWRSLRLTPDGLQSLSRQCKMDRSPEPQEAVLKSASQGELDNGHGLPQKQVQELIRLGLGYRISQCMYVVIALGIPDLLRDGPKTSAELASSRKVDAASLFRVALHDAAQFSVLEAEPT